MSWLVTATVYPLRGEGTHTVQVRWRDDDPWGTVWRALSQALGPYVPREVSPGESFGLAVMRITIAHDAEGDDAAQIPPKELKPTICRLPTELPKGVRF